MVTIPSTKATIKTYRLLSNAATVYPTTLPTSMKPAFTPTKKITKPMKTYKAPFKILANFLFDNFKKKTWYSKKMEIIGTKAIKISFVIVGK